VEVSWLNGGRKGGREGGERGRSEYIASELLTFPFFLPPSPPLQAITTNLTSSGGRSIPP